MALDLFSKLTAQHQPAVSLAYLLTLHMLEFGRRQRKRTKNYEGTRLSVFVVYTDNGVSFY